MKNIELTEDHKSKLLEMCKELFPEVKIHTGMFSDGSQCPEHVLESPMDLEWGTEWNLPYISVGVEQIHWFEFCITKIVNELSWKNIKTDILADCEYENHRMKLITKIFKDKLVGNNFHIVDYLYKQFKKLK